MGFIFILLALLLFFLGCVDQRKMWWKFQAPGYRNPEANEPSDSAFTTQRVVLFIGAVFMVIASFTLT